ncbi:MAG: acetyltransferase [Saprospiraceae bacterium]|nr:acetyltransferase [Saprospiraceae bacterium]MDW8482898.1 acetyltransferase [Saprospiraceae bacterium]
MLPKLIVWGGTGNFKVLCELLHGQYEIIGYFDNNPNIASEYCGIPHLGGWEAFLQWIKNSRVSAQPPHFIVSIGPGHGAVRRQLHQQLKAHGLKPITAVHRTAFVASNAELGEGTQVYAHATVCVDARIGRNCLINTRASIDHECVLEDGASIGPGAVLAGLVHVGENADIYTGAVILPRVRIGANAVVGAGAVVRHDVPPKTVVVGNPATVLRVNP